MNIEYNRFRGQDRQQAQYQEQQHGQPEKMKELQDKNNSNDEQDELEEQDEPVPVERRKRFKMKRKSCSICCCFEITYLLIAIILLIYVGYLNQKTKIKDHDSYVNAFESDQSLSLKIQIIKNDKILGQHVTNDLRYRAGAIVEQTFSLTNYQIFKKPYPQVKITIINNANKMQFDAVGQLIFTYNDEAQTYVDPFQSLGLERDRYIDEKISKYGADNAIFRQKFYTQLVYSDSSFSKTEQTFGQKWFGLKFDEKNKMYFPPLTFNQFFSKETDSINEPIDQKEQNLQQKYNTTIIFCIQDYRIHLFFKYAGPFSYLIQDEIEPFIQLSKFKPETLAFLFYLYFTFRSLANILDFCFWYKQKDYLGMSLRSLYIQFYFEIFFYLDFLFSFTQQQEKISFFRIFTLFLIILKTSEFSFSSKFPFFKICSHEETYVRTTKKYDKQAARYMLNLVIFLFLGSIINSYFLENKPLNWQTPIRNIAQIYQYFGAFIILFPQLYVNYKLKSTKYPQRFIVYNLFADVGGKVVFFDWVEYITFGLVQDIMNVAELYQFLLYNCLKKKSKKQIYNFTYQTIEKIAMRSNFQ